MREQLGIAEQRLLLFSVFVLSLCGITYELVLGSLATYLLGNPVQQYSITIGVFLSSMGIGSYLSRFILKDLIKVFIRVEVILGLVGGISVLALNMIFSFSPAFYITHIFLLTLIGTLVGLEIPVLTRILQRGGTLKVVLSNVLTLDYLGGLAGSLLFPLVLFPFIGRLHTSLIIGIINIIVALIIIFKLEYKGKTMFEYLLPIVSLVILAVLIYFSGTLQSIMQKRLYYDDIVFSKRSKFQEIVLTRNGADFRLYLDGSIQFSTSDEYRYHEMLVYPPIAMTGRDNLKILVLGGGDGLVVRNILKCKRASEIVLVELDRAIVDLAKNNSTMRHLNRDALLDRRVSVIIDDAYKYLIESRKQYNVIIADFPDPHDETIAKLYTEEFYMMVRRALLPGGVFVTQSTSPLFARKAFWCINKTMNKVFNRVIPYHVFIPSFGDWGFNMASLGKNEINNLAYSLPGAEFYTKKALQNAMYFPSDSEKLEVELNTFNRPKIYSYYLEGWRHTDY